MRHFSDATFESFLQALVLIVSLPVVEPIVTMSCQEKQDDRNLMT